MNHGTGEFVRGPIHVNGAEAFWSLPKRGYYGAYHRMSPEHLARCVAEFAGRQNARDLDTTEHTAEIVRGAEAKRLKYDDLIDHGNGRQAVAI